MSKQFDRVLDFLDQALAEFDAPVGDDLTNGLPVRSRSSARSSAWQTRRSSGGRGSDARDD